MLASEVLDRLREVPLLSSVSRWEAGKYVASAVFEFPDGTKWKVRVEALNAQV